MLIEFVIGINNAIAAAVSGVRSGVRAMYARTTGSDVAHMHGGGGKATRAPTPSNDAAAGTTTTSTNGMNVPMSTPLTSSEATGARQVIATAEAATSTTLTTSTSSGSDTAVFNTPVAGPMVCYCNLLICVWMVYRGDTITSAEFLVGTESWCRQRQGQQCSYFEWAGHLHPNAGLNS